MVHAGKDHDHVHFRTESASQGWPWKCQNTIHWNGPTVSPFQCMMEGRGNPHSATLATTYQKQAAKTELARSSGMEDSCVYVYMITAPLPLNWNLLKALCATEQVMKLVNFQCNCPKKAKREKKSQQEESSKSCILWLQSPPLGLVSGLKMYHSEINYTVKGVEKVGRQEA